MRIFLGLFVILLGLLTGYSASRYKAHDIQADVERRTEAELASLETAAEIEVDTDGRHVTLKGYAAGEAEKAAIIERAEDVWGGLGPIDEIELLDVADPYELSAIKDADGHITLSGVVPTETAREALLATAEEVFGDDVESDLTLAAGVPGGDWVGAVSEGMNGLAALNHGRLDASGVAIALSGQAAASEDVDRLSGLTTAMPEGFTWSASLDAPQPDISPFTLAIEKESGAWSVAGFAPDEATRGRLLAKIQTAAGDNEIKADIELADGMSDEDWLTTAGVAIDALAKLEAGRLEINDHDVRIDGDVRSQTDLEALKALQATAPKGANWTSDLVVLRPTVRPYVVEIDKSEEGQWSISGAVPDEASRDALIEAVKDTAEGRDVAAKLQLADGMPGVDWQRFIKDRLAALNSVDVGMLRFEDYDVSLDGTVSTLDDAWDANAEVTAIDPKIATQLEALDSSVDAFLDLRLSPDVGVVVDGALPPGLSEREAVELLGLKPGHSGELSENGRGDADAWRQDLSVIGSYLPEFETVALSLKDGRAAIDGETHAKSDAEQVIDRLTDALDERWRPALSIQTTETQFEDGIRRSNPLSGTEEEHRRGFWLPVTTINAGLDACRERTSLILASNKITFLVGEARLDARARRIINDLSSVVIGCLDGSGDLYLEIGGHTDSRGADDLNQRLSQARADAVLNALADRGVTADALTARGYGETQPIADNASEDGRSANRRITFKWQNGAKADG